jgi:hypothetical protein
MNMNICKDCMNGHHEIIGHNDCDCICHMNPKCDYCGLVLTDELSIAAMLHNECVDSFEESQLPEYHQNEPFGRYPWEQ